MGLDAAGTERALREAFTPEVVAETFRMTLGGGGGLETMVKHAPATRRAGGRSPTWRSR